MSARALRLFGLGAGAFDGDGVLARAFAQAFDFDAEGVALAGARGELAFQARGADLRFELRADVGGGLAAQDQGADREPHRQCEHAAQDQGGGHAQVLRSGVASVMRRAHLNGCDRWRPSQSSTRQNTAFRYRDSCTCARNGWSGPAPEIFSTCTVRFA